MRQPTNIALFEYWNALRDGRPAPFRTDIDPARIAQLLDRVFLIEIDDNRRILFRLAGSTLTAQFGGELRGQELLRYFPVRERPVLAALFAELVRKRQVGVLDISAANREAQTIQLEMVLLPLARPTGVDRFIGALVPHEPVNWASFGPVIVCHQSSRKVFSPETKAVVLPARAPARLPGYLQPQEQYAATATAMPTTGQPAVAGKGRRLFRVFEGGLAHIPRDTPRREES